MKITSITNRCSLFLCFLSLSGCPTDEGETGLTDTASFDGSPATDVFEAGDIFETTDLVEADSGRETGTVNGHVFLNGQADHTGITVVLDGGTGLQNLTDSTGFYQIESVPPGVYTITASLVGYEARTSSAFLVEADEIATSPPVTLEAAMGALAGVVLLEDETDHSGSVVMVRGTSHATISNGDGEWLIEEVAAGNYAVEASHDGFVTISVSDQEVTAGLTTQVPTITLPREPGSISGQVTLFNAADFSAATVVATANWDDSVTCNGVTNTEGYYSTDACPAGTYTVVASRPTYFSSTRDDVVVISGELTPNVDFVLDPVPDELNCNTTCGTCDTGLVYCDGATAECVGDLGSAALNQCGGCSELEGHPQTVCDFGQYWACDGSESVVCREAHPVESVIHTRILGTNATEVDVVGDINSDGLPEVILANRSCDTPDAFIFSGADIVEPTADAILRPSDAMVVLEGISSPVELVGDLDGDELPEFIALEGGCDGPEQTLVFLGSLLSERTTIVPGDAHLTFDLRTSVVGTGGNLDGDSLPDVLLSRDDDLTYVLTGSQLAAGGALETSAATVVFEGRRSCWFPDLDGDERSEVLITRDLCSVEVYFSTELVGEVLQPYRRDRTVFRKTDDSIDWYFRSLDPMPDYDGDGEPGLLVGTFSNTEEPSSFLLNGRDIRLVPENGLVEPWRTFRGAGGPVALLADREGDGLNEMLLGTPQSPAFSRGALFLLGSSTLSALSAEEHVDTVGASFIPTTSTEFGATLAVGDIDGNGLDDLLVGALEDLPYSPPEYVVYYIPNRLTCEDFTEPVPCEPLACEAGESTCSTLGEAITTCDEVGLGASRVACALGEACEGHECEPANLEILSGDGQEGKHGQLVDLPMVVRLTSESDRPLAGVEVAWSSPTFALLGPLPSFSDVDGYASVNMTPGTNPAIDTEQVLAAVGPLTVEFAASVSGAFVEHVEPWPININETTVVDIYGAGFITGSHVSWDGPTGVYELAPATLEPTHLTVNVDPTHTSAIGAVTVEIVDPEMIRSNRFEIGVSPDGFTFVPPGHFRMGSPPEEPGRSPTEILHDVLLTRSFFVQTTEVTQEEWGAVMAANPSPFPECGGNCPITGISLWSVLEYLNRLSDLEGFDPCYVLSDCSGDASLGTMDCAAEEVAGGDPYLCNGFRLLTEAEWEYSTRAGTTSARYCGDDESCVDEIAWTHRNSGDVLHPVAQLTPNSWGLFDVSGNVDEMVWDYYSAWYFEPGLAIDPFGPTLAETTHGHRVVRGGTYNGGSTRSAAREGTNPEGAIREGFRVARTVAP